MRPAAASLNALVALLALGAMHPKEVLLMRPYELLQQEEVRQADGMERLEEECKTRSVRSMSYSLASLLGSMPVGVLINSRLIVTNSTELKETTPRDFDEKFRQNCAIPPLYAPEARRAESLARVYVGAEMRTLPLKEKTFAFRVGGPLRKPPPPHPPRLNIEQSVPEMSGRKKMNQRSRSQCVPVSRTGVWGRRGFVSLSSERC
ncbi:unnamed protein product [Prorocentrum cordatum]|uniref:Uncharacterized protein n=2 Tax=Prorocentrum cordatum TaxID=2364126 RepID=A0ABN9V2E5_9DINO|nr:unnamed protein product [Polarella glacialis]